MTIAMSAPLMAEIYEGNFKFLETLFLCLTCFVPTDELLSFERVVFAGGRANSAVRIKLQSLHGVIFGMGMNKIVLIVLTVQELMTNFRQVF